MAPDQKPDRQSRIEASGDKQHRPRTDKSERRGFARRNRNAVRLDPAKPRQSSHATVAAPTAGAADCDDRVGLIVSQRRFERASLAEARMPPAS